MLRAHYDHNGNIILGSIVKEIPKDTHEKSPVSQTHADTWTLLEETRSEVREIKNPEPFATTKKKPTALYNVGSTTKAIIRQSIEESSRQLSRTSADAGSGIAHIKNALSHIPEKTAESMKAFWNVAKSPVRMPGRKPGKRQHRKITLFMIDTVRFGGTFGLIFGVLFVGMNYQSFWQIARAELALGENISTEQALTDLSGGSSTVKAFRASHSSGNANILKYLPSVGPYEDRLIIPKLGKNIPIVRPSMDALMREDWKQFEVDIQDALRDGVVHYPGSAQPGQAGNFFLTGHSSYLPWDDGRYKDVFARLHELELGDTYTVYYGGDHHTYRITKKYEVKPNNVSVLDQPTSQRKSTLMTCTPVGTTLRRLIVEAEEIDPASGEILKVGEKTVDVRDNPFTRLEALPI